MDIIAGGLFKRLDIHRMFPSHRFSFKIFYKFPHTLCHHFMRTHTLIQYTNKIHKYHFIKCSIIFIDFVSNQSFVLSSNSVGLLNFYRWKFIIYSHFVVPSITFYRITNRTFKMENSDVAMYFILIFISFFFNLRSPLFISINKLSIKCEFLPT